MVLSPHDFHLRLLPRDWVSSVARDARALPPGAGATTDGERHARVCTGDGVVGAAGAQVGWLVARAATAGDLIRGNGATTDHASLNSVLPVGYIDGAGGAVV